jgi:hypothetical protein
MPAVTQTWRPSRICEKLYTPAVTSVLWIGERRPFTAPLLNGTRN